MSKRKGTEQLAGASQSRAKPSESKSAQKKHRAASDTNDIVMQKLGLADKRGKTSKVERLLGGAIDEASDSDETVRVLGPSKGKASSKTDTAAVAATPAGGAPKNIADRKKLKKLNKAGAALIQPLILCACRFAMVFDFSFAAFSFAIRPLPRSLRQAKPDLQARRSMSLWKPSSCSSA